MKTFSWTVVFSCMFMFLGCVPLEKMDRASGSIEETDYLQSLSGIYEAVIQPETGDRTIITLLLYPDGSCLFSEKTIGGLSGQIRVSTGRWDNSDFSEGVTLNLKSNGGARRVIPCVLDKEKGSLKYSGQGYGAGGLILVRK